MPLQPRRCQPPDSRLAARELAEPLPPAALTTPRPLSGAPAALGRRQESAAPPALRPHSLSSRFALRRSTESLRGLGDRRLRGSCLEARVHSRACCAHRPYSGSPAWLQRLPRDDVP